MKYEASLIVPIFNEIQTLNSLCVKLKENFKPFQIKYIFIDDGSIDGSKDWLKKNLEIIFSKSEFELIFLEKNYGKGYAVNEGLKKIEGKYTIFIDSDLEYDPKDLLEMYKSFVPTALVLNKSTVHFNHAKLAENIEKHFEDSFLDIADIFKHWLYSEDMTLD